jgi:hypothetical protein
MSIAINAVDEHGVPKSDEPTPRTPLGAKLRALREKILAAGDPTLGWDEISQEIATRRGGVR